MSDVPYDPINPFPPGPGYYLLNTNSGGSVHMTRQFIKRTQSAHFTTDDGMEVDPSAVFVWRKEIGRAHV